MEKKMFERVEIADPWEMEAKIQEYYLSLNIQRTEPRHAGDANINPSSLVREPGSKCNKYLGYQAIGTFPNPKIPVWTYKRFASGRAIHEERQRILQIIYGDDIEIEASISIPELQLKGKIDGVLNSRFGWEFKPVSSAIFATTLRGNPRQSDVDQTLFYFKGRNLDSVTLNYINMDGKHDEHIVVITFDEQRYNYYERRIIDEVLEPIAAEQEPVKYVGSWCGDCPYRLPCNKGIFE